jgi:CelD/BcsL family acetyltransferase involved in cellulose biosynthesis
MRYEAIPASEIDEGLICAWETFQCRQPCFDSPFLSPWFTKIVASVRDDIFVTVLEDGGEIVGFFPHQRRNRRALPVAGRLNDCQAVIVSPGTIWSPIDLLSASKLDVWHFDHQIAAQEEFSLFTTRREQSPIIQLENGFEDYVKQQKRARSGRIEQLRRKRRKLRRENGGDCNVRFEATSLDDRALREVIERKIKQCERTGHPVFFRERWAVELVERLLAQDQPGCVGALSVLSVGEEIAAAHFGIRSRHVWHWWFPTYSPKWSQYSPGQLLLLNLCEHVGDTTVQQHTIDLGRGDEPYKGHFANSAYPLIEGHVASRLPYKVVYSVKASMASWARKRPAFQHLRTLRRKIKRSPAVPLFLRRL